MNHSSEYVLGESVRAAHRLEIQDGHFAEASEQLLDDVGIRQNDRVVELGCGPGGFSTRIMRRLGADGVLVGVDSSQGLLSQAQAKLAQSGPARFEPTLADIAELGSWLNGANVVVGRAVLHHVPMAELVLGRLRARLQPGSRLGFIEPDFRSPLGRIGYMEATGRSELAPLRIWAFAINNLYLANRLSPAVGATLAATFQTSGYRNVRSACCECPSSANTIENMRMFYDEVRDRLASLGILTTEQSAEQQRLLAELKIESLPPAWGVFRVTCDV
jgi:ubiquinone/menaquinone biosynthesis C-methylase UbiE